MGAALGMASTAQQEGIGDAFLLAVAATAGCAVSLRRPDDDSVDWTLSCQLPRKPKLDVQMKTTINDTGVGENIQYPLKKKNYDDLILTDLLVPRVLVLVVLSRDAAGWLVLSAEEMILRKCVYWVSLAGLPESDNATTVTVSVPRANQLTPGALQGMMQTISEGGGL